MLPSRGYFHDIQCPDDVCGRPYCHFGHRSRRKPVEIPEDESSTVSPGKPGIPTYKPTPKSELEQRNTHIPISYVPDLAFRPERNVRPPSRFENKPVYKPTPINLLSSINTSLSEHNEEQKEQIIDLQQDIANNEYDPSKADYVVPTTDDINFEDLSSEFDQIDDILNEEDTLSENLSKLNDDIKKEQDRLNLLLQSDALPEDVKTEVKTEDSSNKIKIEKEETINATNFKNTDKKSCEKSFSHRRKENKDKLNDSPKKSGTSSQNKSSSNLVKDKKEKSSSKDRSSSKESKEKTKYEKDKSNSKEKSNKEKPDKHKTDNKEREKHRKEEKKDSSKCKEDKREKFKNKSPEKSSTKDNIISEAASESEKDKYKKKEKLSSEINKTSSRKEKEARKEKSDSKNLKKRKDSESSETISENEKIRNKEKKKSDRSSSSKSKEDSKEKSDRSKCVSVSPEKSSKKDNSNSKNKEKREKSKETLSSPSKHHKERKRSRSRSSSRSKKEKKSDKNKNSEKESKKRKKSPDSHFEEDSDSSPRHKKFSSSKSNENKTKSRDKVKKTSSSRSSQSKDQPMIRELPRKSSESDFAEGDIHMSDLDIDFDDEVDTMEECYRIFNEYSVEEKVKEDVTLDPGVEKTEQSDDLSFSSLVKKRVAYPNAETSKPYGAPKPKECKIVAPTPGQIMANRYKVAKLAQADHEQEGIMNEVRQITSVKTAPSLLEAARLHKLKRLERERLKKERESKPCNNVVDDILNGTARKPTIAGIKVVTSKKINAVPNVALIEKAKERIAQVRKHREEPVKTIAQTQKGGRVAHIPQVSLPDIPDVLQAASSKLPVNVRTRFLTLLAEECFKLYCNKQDAYDRALNEEFACYEKCKVLTTYRNSAMLAVNRLRKEIQERQGKNLGPLLSGESTQADKTSDFKGKRFYENVKRWLLTEEELELHGYPRESGERGRAVIMCEKKVEEDFSLVDDNQRKCCRCSRIYQVDDDGWPLYEDDCMYHPMKKRTIRGQQVFLCCKSTDDTGCMTSDSHVSEALHNGVLEGYQTTMPPERDNDPRSVSVYALDCEMCYTTKGLELTRVTIVDTECKTVYESLVKPLNPIIDYNTQFSGITKDQMDRTSTNILQVQANILHLCNADTILVGHSLESDMKALKIVHSSVIDTAVLFPHKMGLPHKRALRSLASEYLRKIIQNDVGGHDSAEDAVTCMELIKWKLKEELKLPSK